MGRPWDYFRLSSGKTLDRTLRSVRADRQAVDRCSAHPTLVMLGFQADIGEGSFDGRPEQQTSPRTNSVYAFRASRRVRGRGLESGDHKRAYRHAMQRL